MANVSFHVGTSAPGTSGLTTDGLYFNKSGGGIYYATSTTACSEVASKVSFSRSLTSGTKIGTITINGTGTDLYCQTNTDTKCSYASSSKNAEYPLLFKPSTSTTTTAASPSFDTGITVNPSTNKITASLFSGYLVPKLVASGTNSSYTFSAGFYTVTWKPDTAASAIYSTTFYFPGSGLFTIAAATGSSGVIFGNITNSLKVSWGSNVQAWIYLWGA